MAENNNRMVNFQSLCAGSEIRGLKAKQFFAGYKDVRVFKPGL
jgi:hypothetical protein